MRGQLYAQPKVPTLVEIQDASGKAYAGQILLTIGSTVGEHLNSSTPFLEFIEVGKEKSAYIAKAHIAFIATADMPAAAPLCAEDFAPCADDPCDILGVPKGVSWYAVRSAYVQLAKAYHPDQFASVKLPNEVNRYLQTRLRRINAAYAMLEAAWRGKTGAAPTSKATSP